MIEKYINNLKNPGTRMIIRLLYKDAGNSGIKLLQQSLNILGKYLQVDGIIGPITVHAIKSVDNKRLHKIIEDLYLGKGEDSVTSPFWLELAFKELGVKEIPGRNHNPRILEYHSVSGGFGTDEVPWCASFINFIMLKAGYKGPKWPAAAKSWLNFGKSSLYPTLGSIAVKSRKGGGHVCFVIGKSEDSKYLYCLGGNQNNEVNIRKYPASVFIDFRIPLNYIPKSVPVYTGKNKIDIGGKES